MALNHSKNIHCCSYSKQAIYSTQLLEHEGSVNSHRHFASKGYSSTRKKHGPYQGQETPQGKPGVTQIYDNQIKDPQELRTTEEYVRNTSRNENAGHSGCLMTALAVPLSVTLKASVALSSSPPHRLRTQRLGGRRRAPLVVSPLCTAFPHLGSIILSCQKKWSVLNRAELLWISSSS